MKQRPRNRIIGKRPPPHITAKAAKRPSITAKRKADPQVTGQRKTPPPITGKTVRPRITAPAKA